MRHNRFNVTMVFTARHAEASRKEEEVFLRSGQQPVTKTTWKLPHNKSEVREVSLAVEKISFFI